MRSALPEKAEIFSCPNKFAEWAYLQNLDAVLMSEAPVGICKDVMLDLESSLATREIKIIKRRHWWDTHFSPAARTGFLISKNRFLQHSINLRIHKLINEEYLQRFDAWFTCSRRACNASALVLRYTKARS